MTLKERVRRIKDWCVEHKTEIAIVTVSAVGCGAMCYSVKKICGLSKAQLEETFSSNDIAYEEFETGMFMNGVRKQFLSTSDGGTITDITDTFDCLIRRSL